MNQIWVLLVLWRSLSKQQVTLNSAVFFGVDSFTKVT
jgi:hypothetical protein